MFLGVSTNDRVKYNGGENSNAFPPLHPLRGWVNFILFLRNKHLVLARKGVGL